MILCWMITFMLGYGVKSQRGLYLGGSGSIPAWPLCLSLIYLFIRTHLIDTTSDWGDFWA